MLKRLVSQGNLNAPWGLVIAPRHFGAFGGDLLVGNFGDGAINAYDAESGHFEGQLTNGDGNPIHIDGLWALRVRQRHHRHAQDAALHRRHRRRGARPVRRDRGARGAPPPLEAAVGPWGPGEGPHGPLPISVRRAAP